jgi:hypothetical protein
LHDACCSRKRNSADEAAIKAVASLHADMIYEEQEESQDACLLEVSCRRLSSWLFGHVTTAGAGRTA